MKTLTKKVIEQLGYDSLDKDCITTLQDIYNYGVGGGFSGFTYYNDTVKFFDDNRKLILTELADYSDSLGESVPDIVKSFGCLQINNDENWNHEIDQVLMGLDCDDDTQVKNALAWWAAEHVAFESGFNESETA